MEAGDRENGSARPSYFSALSRASCFIRRDLRREALFGWITPLLAAWSSHLAASRTASSASFKSPDAMAWRACLTSVRARERWRWFCSRTRASRRMRFLADLVFAKAYLLFVVYHTSSQRVILAHPPDLVESGSGFGTESARIRVCGCLSAWIGPAPRAVLYLIAWRSHR